VRARARQRHRLRGRRGPVDSPFIKGEAKARLQNVEQLLNDWDIEAAAKELELAEKVAPKTSSRFGTSAGASRSRRATMPTR